MVEFHESVQRLCVVETPPDALLKILDQNSHLSRLVRNEWLHLPTMNPENSQIHEFRNGVFKRYYPDRLKLIGTKSNRNGIGARLVLHTSQGDLFRFVTGGGSYLSQSSYSVFWGVSVGVKVNGMTISWPSGNKQIINDIELGHLSFLIEM